MHCGLPWWREFGGRESNIEDPPPVYTICHDPHILQYSVPTHAWRHACHTRIEAAHRCYLCTKRNIPGRFRFCALSAGNNLHAAPNQPTVKEGQHTRTHMRARARTGWRNLAPILMIIGAPRFAGSGQITPSKKGEILVPLFGSNVARWMCIWINFLFDNGLMKRLNRRSAGLSRLVSLNEKGKG